MNISSLIRSRRTIHEFSEKAIEPSLLKEALELAMWAPNHRLTFPWGFFEFSAAQKQVVADYALEWKAKKNLDFMTNETRRQAERQKFVSVPHLIWVLQRKSGNPIEQKEDYASVSCGLQNTSLFLWSHGVGTKWTTGPVTMDPRLFTLTGISGEQFEPCGLLWVGFPQRLPPAADREIQIKGGFMAIQEKKR